MLLTFQERDFISESADSNKYRRSKILAKRRLKGDAVPTVFPKLPKYLSSEADEDPRPLTSAICGARAEKENAKIEAMITTMEIDDQVGERSDLMAAFSSSTDKPQGFVPITDDDTDFYVLLRVKEAVPIVSASLQTNNDTTFILRYEGAIINVESYESNMKFHIKCVVSAIFKNILAFFKSWNSQTSNGSFQCLNSSIRSFTDSVEKYSHYLNNELSNRLSFLCEPSSP